MNSQFQLFHGGTYQATGPAPGLRRISSGEALHLGHLGGELTVLEGRIWLTRDGDLGDHVIGPGQKLRLAVAENAVIEPARAGSSVVVRWSPRRQGFLGALVAEPLRGLAFLADRAAGVLAALARSAAASARRAQGSISAGDSMASSGALK
jgi:hypothetical protein